MSTRTPRPFGRLRSTGAWRSSRAERSRRSRGQRSAADSPPADGTVRDRVPSACGRRSGGRRALVPRTKRDRVRRFRRELDRAVDLIAERPVTGSPYLGNTRRILLRRFPFFVVYRQRGENVQILAGAHARRRPGYWRTRSRAALTTSAGSRDGSGTGCRRRRPCCSRRSAPRRAGSRARRGSRCAAPRCRRSSWDGTRG